MKYLFVGITIFLVLAFSMQEDGKKLAEANLPKKQLTVLELKRAYHSIPELEKFYAIKWRKSINKEVELIDHMAYYQELNRLIERLDPPFLLNQTPVYSTLPMVKLLKTKKAKLEQIILNYKTVSSKSKLSSEG